MEIQELVYSSLLDELVPEYQLPWVQPIFIPRHPCYEEYAKMHEVYMHLRERLGVEEEDEEVERIIDALLAHGKILALEMFRYGRMYERMLYMK